MLNIKKISAMLLAVILAVACKDSDKKMKCHLMAFACLKCKAIKAKAMNKKQIPIIVYAIVLLIGILSILIMYLNYESTFLQDKIASHVKKNCKNRDDCYLSLKDITNFEWDKFYIIKIGADINKILGFEYSFNRDISTSYVFLKDGKIVYHYEDFLKGTLDFEMIPEKYTFCESVNSCQNENDYLLFSPDEANFYVKEWWSDRIKKNRYHLYPERDSVE
jgi:hypothetical protein